MQRFVPILLLVFSVGVESEAHLKIMLVIKMMSGVMIFSIALRIWLSVYRKISQIIRFSDTDAAIHGIEVYCRLTDYLVSHDLLGLFPKKNGVC